jgi:hypothetical protein
MTARTAIIGSCVTRDAFTASLSMSVAYYRARTSPLSQLAQCRQLDLLPPDGNGNFLAKCIAADFRKDILAEIEKVQPDFIVLDFIDERFNLLMRDDEIVVQSDDMVKLGLHKRLLERRFLTIERNAQLENTARAYETYVRLLTQIVPEDRIILHRAPNLETYINTSGDTVRFENSYQEKVLFRNTLMDSCIAAARISAPEAHVVDVSSEMRADENNRWGLSGFHYEPEYYKRFRAALRQIAGLPL